MNRAPLTWLRNAGAWFLLLFALHCAGAAYYFPLAGFVTNRPLASSDYGYHFYDAFAAAKFAKGAAQLWGYDPFFLAGYPSNVLDNLDNRLIELGLIAFGFMGEPRAYNGMVLALFLCVPVFVLVASRLFGLDRWSALFASLLALIVLYTDSFAVSMWRTGSISFLAASAASPLGIGLLERFLVEKTWRAWLWFTAALVLISLLHGFAFFILLVPCLVLYASAARTLNLKQHLAIWSIPIVVLAVNLYWLLPSLHYLPLVNGESLQLQGGITALVADARGAVWLQTTNIFTTAGLRWSITLLGLVRAWMWWRETRSRAALSLAAGMLALTLFAYLGSYIPRLSALETFRYVVPVMFLACVPAARWLTRIRWQPLLASRPPKGLLRLAAVSALALFVMVSTARGAASNVLRLDSPDARSSAVRLLPTPCQMNLVTWIRRNTTPDARILIQDNRTGALLPYFVKRQVIGGPYFQRQLAHNFANASFKTIFQIPITQFHHTLLEETLRAFNVGWIISDKGAALKGSLTNYIRRREPPFVELLATACNYRIYRTTFAHSFFLEGSGNVEADYNTLRVSNASPGSVVLKYHWLDTLRTEPPMKLAEVSVLNDPIGFIQVNNGAVRDFVVYNSYSY